MKNKVQLIAYANRLSGGTLKILHELMKQEFSGLFGGIHLLPFFTHYDGQDAGFDPINHSEVDKRLGSWQDIAEIAKEYEVVADMIVNHISSGSSFFLDYLKKGERSVYADLFLRFSDVFPQGATEKELASIYRTSSDLPFSTYPLSTEENALFWTTFNSEQLDLNIKSDSTWHYLNSVLEVFSQHNIKCVRLDAAGYVAKKSGTSCFMLPEAFDFISKLKKAANKKGIEVLVEIHTHHSARQALSKHADYIYDFSLPALVLHALARRTGRHLKEWLQKAPANLINVLDTHDGIDVYDIGPSSENTQDGLLTANEVNFLVNSIHNNSRGESLDASGDAANNLDCRQINCTYYDALGGDEHQYLLARLLQFFSPGIPQIYYLGLLAGSNDTELLNSTGEGRDINRTYFSQKQIADALERKVVQQLFSLIKFRNTCPAFNGDFSLLDSQESQLAVRFKNENDSASLTVNFSDLSFLVTTISGSKGIERHYQKWDDF